MLPLIAAIPTIIAWIVSIGVSIGNIIDWISKKAMAWLAAHKLWAIFFFGALLLVVFTAWGKFFQTVLHFTFTRVALNSVPPLLKQSYAALNVYFPADEMISTYEQLTGIWVLYFAIVKAEFLFTRIMRIYGHMCLGWKS